MSELEARERYYWSKIRQALKVGDTIGAGMALGLANVEYPTSDLTWSLRERIATTFTAGLAALGDPAPLDKEQDNG